MPKLRNADTPEAAFAQWIGRKCRNHAPLDELGLMARDTDAHKKLRSSYVSKVDSDVTVLTEDPSVIVYEAHGRVFEVVVREVEPEKYEGAERLKVAY